MHVFTQTQLLKKIPNCQPFRLRPIKAAVASGEYGVGPSPKAFEDNLKAG
jgi:hypothetical protein